ncbi:hypothetical protein ABFS83_04G129700 [Erythranthe nasuta]
MDVEKVFHMKGGLGETSYFNNSSIQKSVAEKMMGITMETIEEMYVTLRPKSLGVADLGCSSGSNAMSYIKRIVGAVQNTAKKFEQPAPNEIRVCLNDLPTNDFNTIFQALPDLYEELNKTIRSNIFIGAFPGSFFGRLFPENSLHFVYSFNCLHWLSRVPPGIYDERGSSLNKKSVYISKNSPPQVCKAYAKQFKEDFTTFLKSRSRELVHGGRMVLVFTVRNGADFYSKDNTFLWELLYQSLRALVSKGTIEEEKLESFDVHYYRASKEEIEDVVKEEGSFKLEYLEMFEKEMKLTSNITVLAKAVRAVQEPMVSHHFGDAVMDSLYDEYGRLLELETAKQDICKFIDIALVLGKL